MLTVILSNEKLIKNSEGRIISLGDENCTRVVNTIAEASEAIKQYIDEKYLGSSCFTGGDVYDENNVQVARISYNGRAWDLNDSPIAF